MSFCSVHSWRGHKYLNGTCLCGKSKVNSETDNLIKTVLKHTSPSFGERFFDWITYKSIGLIFILFIGIVFFMTIMPTFISAAFSVDNSSGNLTSPLMPHFPIWLFILIPGLIIITLMLRFFKFDSY